MEKPTVTPAITQAMINAYDEYTHLSLDRRGFMEKLTRLAGSGAAAAAIMPMLAANQANAALTPENDERLTASMVTYPGASGEMKGYLVTPKDAKTALPGVIVIHENRGLNPHIQDVTRRLALEGFVTLAPDFLSPQGGTPEDEDKARDMFTTLDLGTTVNNAEASRAYLAAVKGVNGKVGAIGFCWGGGMVNRLAIASPQLGAGVAYYGAQPPAEQVPAINAPLMLHYAGLDERINAGIDAYRKALEANGKQAEIFVYDGVNHAFNNDTSAARYNKEAADLAWSRTVAFLKKNLA
ncbi:dienelactone hydrolase family protein [Agrobacterium vitis]|uniref:Dienelactone hydrolase family protein n=1 Tax=Agrobacterium vitis TaxID=373 RepID=A0ABD6G723_AGRVI|nr:dienelactone hydrolase family protein [Agrobacterium vitis]MUO78474.1 dienelactone hydrolase family protein [Agrobacterium vitis]MUO95310.1 dienelactone hydrolase family protein [Agrobacterium vitis]MUP04885.1 dienelactone hydrolase family protein [Agrobacterium vitis]MUZ83764.1 dienelactone hydrolase family protein [Agrobacterium vitis]MVA09363.1 dienelactone hydrolase family protein [Agrobacterium vitis]